MGQQKVIDILEKAEKPLSRSEIAKLLDERNEKVSLWIKKMLRYNEIKCMEINRVQAKKHYNCKRRMRIYYI